MLQADGVMQERNAVIVRRALGLVAVTALVSSALVGCSRGPDAKTLMHNCVAYHYDGWGAEAARTVCQVEFDDQPAYSACKYAEADPAIVDREAAANDCDAKWIDGGAATQGSAGGADGASDADDDADVAEEPQAPAPAPAASTDTSADAGDAPEPPVADDEGDPMAVPAGGGVPTGVEGVVQDFLQATQGADVDLAIDVLGAPGAGLSDMFGTYGGRAPYTKSLGCALGPDGRAYLCDVTNGTDPLELVIASNADHAMWLLDSLYSADPEN
ncbi:hypothetical protein [Luteimicrobium subarcticum]|uniref:Uncharacterized protein n=1 Tax=Luteimicrobium subarcticum TaxID=620910 RepID=A0A2M8W719_9MICO|nr:hypothetical protein [Luteimicrobium subarcticum]PJI86718.1 hypothetical protein CLV34_2638 [Luteimicrobium subarcticum]